MREYPERWNKKRLVKIYKNFALYEGENGERECFDEFDLGMIPKRRSVNEYDFEKRMVNQKDGQGKKFKILQYDLEHRLIREHDNLYQASLDTGIDTQNISLACRKGTKSGKCFWEKVLKND